MYLLNMDKLWNEMSKEEQDSVILSKHLEQPIEYKLWAELTKEEREKVIEEIYRVYYECNLDVVGVKK